MIKLVIFDLDGVITSTTDEHFAAWDHLFKKYFRINLDPALEAKTKGVSRIESLEVLLDHYNLVITESQKLDFAEEKNLVYQEMIAQFDEMKLMEGVIPLLNFLKHLGVKIALGSASKNGPFLLECLGVVDYFDYVVNPSKLKSKPEPDIFLDAMNNFKLKPNECIGVEDAVAGVEAINRAGMIAIGIGSEPLHKADIWINKLSELDFELFEKLIHISNQAEIISGLSTKIPYSL
ncbi:MAG: beta-phosphoglucomutase [Ignavibacteria bacterium]|nr:beta-phosphoglucomutase [Ignavibacteria bacterium]